jgi:hypothetical protein
VKNGGGSVTSGKAVLTVPPASARSLSLVAGHIGGAGNLEGADGRMAWPTRIALSPAGVLYVADDPGALTGGATTRRATPSCAPRIWRPARSRPSTPTRCARPPWCSTPPATCMKPPRPRSTARYRAAAIDALTVGMDDNVCVMSENAVLRIVQ